MLVNQDYRKDKRKHKGLLDQEGQEIQEIVEDWLGKLCHQMEKGQNGAYSNKLSDKFMGEVTKYFPYYHDIGVNQRQEAPSGAIQSPKK